MTDPDQRLDDRQKMIASQLAARGIDSQRVVDAMLRVPREHFVPQEATRCAYSDQALPIDCGQTISQPFIVALMSQSLELTGTQHVLEIGTGSGYQTAILCELAGDVVTLERHAALSEQAARRLTDLHCENVEFVIADGVQGWRAAEPYDRIIITAATEECPAALFEQLGEGGVIVGPFGPPSGQMLQQIRKRGGKPVVTNLVPCRFVPLLPGVPTD